MTDSTQTHHPRRMSESTMRESCMHALRMAERGYAVFPAARRSRKPAYIVGLCEHGFNSATRDPDIIRAWWDAQPDAGVGINLERSGILAVDCDSPEAIIEAQAQGLPATVERHSRFVAFLYRRPLTCPIDRAIGVGESGKLDLLSAGGLIAVNIHPHGHRVYLSDIVPVADLPEPPAWAVAWLHEHARPKREWDGSTGTHASDDLGRVLDELTCGSPCACQHGDRVHCPVCIGETPPLSVTLDHGYLLVHCFRGCAQADVVDALKRRGVWPAPPPDERPPDSDWDGSTVELTPDADYWRHRALAAEAERDRLRETLQARGLAMQNTELTPLVRVIADVAVMEAFWTKDSPVRQGVPNHRTYSKTLAEKAGASRPSVTSALKVIADDMTTKIDDGPPTAPLLKYQEKYRPGDVDPLTGEILDEPRTFTSLVPNYPTAAEVYRALADWRPPPALLRKTGERRAPTCPRQDHGNADLIRRTLLQCPVDGEVFEDSHPELPLVKIFTVGNDPTNVSVSVPIESKIFTVGNDDGCHHCGSLFALDPDGFCSQTCRQAAAMTGAA